MWYWIFKYILIGPILRLMGRPRIEGAEHLPDTGPIILAGNHLTVVDSFFLVLVVPRRVRFVAKSEYFSGGGLKGALIRWFYTSAGQVPIDRSGSEAAEPALDAARKIIADNAIWAIYPEGTRSPDGRLYKGKTGMARVALETGAPVVPVVMFGTEKFNPVGSRMWRPARIVVRFGPALDFSRYRELAAHRAVVRSATDEVMAALRTLSGQEYVDTYAATQKAADSQAAA
ncbi:lysophospholipid acyltransferase family protein [Rhodococcus sp. G-MC3]|uniref:lysophospholipid acyltransferase family protein n=1 Tax=Rhodococcus sp. G-MC3 TaxID=3046209 RepID=UPI0024BA845C|nr:lysophospholipid acyltransferase family protein [Rhodococcus sp. G-MC3]MDJ0391840.1 lysophospholipid acyltransferase family protein [Rhodococcus sp. G-MC3]